MISIAKYLTIAQNAHQEMTIKKSRFITRLYRIHTVAEAQEKIQQVKKLSIRQLITVVVIESVINCNKPTMMVNPKARPDYLC